MQGSTGNYSSGSGEQAHSFGELGSLHGGGGGYSHFFLHMQARAHQKYQKFQAPPPPKKKYLKF